MSSIAASSGTEAPAEEFRWGWPVVLACFFTATFAWGFGFYGNSGGIASSRSCSPDPCPMQ